MILWPLGWVLAWLVRRLAGPVFDVDDEALDEAIGDGIARAYVAS